MTDNDDSNSSFYCPITAEIMKDPVIDREGNSYERKAIEKWIKIHRISPITRNPMTIADLTPNRALKDAIIMQFKDNNNAVKPKKWNLLSFFNYPLAKCKSNKIDEDDLPSETKSPEIFIDPIPTKEVVHFQVPYATLTGNTYRVREHKNKNKILSSNGITPTNNTEIRSHEQELNVHISTSCNKGIRLPTDIVVVIDVSASMSDIANTQVIENSHLCILDIVKHAVNTIIHTLSDQDRLAIVKFSNSANTVLPLTIMNEYGKKSAESALNKLHPNGMTNLWDAIEMALNILKISNLQTIRSVKNSAIFVLTDGEPNIIPAKGNLPMLNQYKENNHGLLPGIINTFGFGYTLDSKLLHDIASIGNGIFSFIPDAGFVGTVFVNALANTLATVITNATLEITPYSGVKIENFDKYDEKQQILSIGGIQSYQTKDIVISAVVPKLYQGTVVKVILRYSSNASNHSQLVIIEKTFDYNMDTSSPISPIDSMVKSLTSNNALLSTYEYQSQIFRLNLIDTIVNIIKNIPTGSNEKKLFSGKIYITCLLNQINEWIDKNVIVCQEIGIEPTSYKRIVGIKEDLEGQISMALSRVDWYDRWGIHYLTSLKKSHEMQQCSNFKDLSIRYYGGNTFTEIRDYADEVFCSLPPPTSSNINLLGKYNSTSLKYKDGASFDSPKKIDRNRNSSVDTITETESSTTDSEDKPDLPKKSFDMSAYNNKHSGCIHESCLISLVDNSTKPISSIKRGDVLLYGNIVECVIRTKCRDDSATMIVFPCGLIITSWHPIIENDDWIFPINSSNGVIKSITVKYMYTLLVSKNPKYSNDKNVYADRIVVNNTCCITLAHGLNNNKIAKHDFFGTNKIVDCLKSFDGWITGLVTLDSNSYKRDEKTNLINGLIESNNL